MATITGESTQTLSATQQATGSYSGGKKALVSKNVVIATGTGANQCNLMHHTAADATNGKSIIAGGNTDYDLTALVDAEGAALSTLAEVCYLRIEAVSTNGGELEVKASAANGWSSFFKDPTDVIKIEPGAAVTIECWAAAAYAVAGANKSINVTNTDGGAAAYFGITLLGRNA